MHALQRLKKKQGHKTVLSATSMYRDGYRAIRTVIWLVIGTFTWQHYKEPCYIYNFCGTIVHSLRIWSIGAENLMLKLYN
jgi:hypothetical protein